MKRPLFSAQNKIPRLKLRNNNYNNMSEQKIKRLKTPLKRQDSFKSPESTILTNVYDIEQSTISLIKSVQCSQSLQVALINQINKVYKEIAGLKDQVGRYRQIGSELEQQKKILEKTINKLTQEMHNYKEMYDLEVINHQQLRKFYQQRQLEWRLIVDEHRRLLEEYDRQHLTSLSKLNNPVACEQLLDQINKSCDKLESSIYKSDQYLHSSFQKKQSRNLKTSSLQRHINSPPKLKLRKEKSKQLDYYKEISRLYNEESKFTSKSKEEYLSMQKDQMKIKSTHKNAEIDDFFDKVLRKTYYTFKEKCISVAEIEDMEDMKKLKTANTSTKERLNKTIKKLNFELENEKELKLFCQYVEKAVIDRFKTFRGDFAFELLVEKLKQCQKLALSSNSQLERLDIQKSNVQDEKISFSSNKLTKNNDAGPSQLKLCSKNPSDIEKISQKNLQLLLNSTIKSDSKRQRRMFCQNLSSHSRCSNSSSNSLRYDSKSDLYNRQQGQDKVYFKFGKRESMNELCRQ